VSHSASLPQERHRSSAPAAAEIRVALLTVSDSRTPATNAGGRLLRRLADDAGWTVADEALLPDEPEALRARIVGWANDGDTDATLITGGTGLAPRDQTPEAIVPLFDRRLPGFGELFRMLSFQEIGAAAMLSRADAGVIGRMAAFLLPGSPAAIELAMRKLILPELGHLVGLLRPRAGAPHGK
jgi:molybdenum cofactor biosynthesis protein B